MSDIDWRAPADLLAEELESTGNNLAGKILRMLERGLRHEDEQVRQSVIRGVTRIREVIEFEVREVLMDAAEDDASKAVRKLAKSVL